MNRNGILGKIAEIQDLSGFRDLHWEGDFEAYLDSVRAEPAVARSAYQRLYDMIVSYDYESYTQNREKLIHYNFFDDPFESGKDAVFGIDRQLMELVQVFRSAAHRYGTERRVILLHGPVGTAKSTIVRLLKKGLEHYSRTEDGRLYSFRWEPDEGEMMDCPMHEDPLHLIPVEYRHLVLKEINNGNSGTAEEVVIQGDLCPACRFVFNELLEKAGGDWIKVVEQVRVKRILLSEKDRIGIGTFQPKDEKNQDSTELTGDINYRKIAEYGSDSDPRAFNFDGELNIANRGIVEFIEILKLDVAFLYDLLTASQEHKIKPKKFAHTDIDEVILGHTNEAEYRRLLNNEYMEALRDRTIKIDVPYNTRYADEVRIYERDFNAERVVGKHIAPHTLELAAFWAVLTRLEEPKRAGLTLVQKLRLYDGRSLPGFTEDTIIELQAEARNEGMFGISPRYVQDKISNALVSYPDRTSLNPFMILRELENGLRHHSLITSKEQRKHFRELLTIVRAEYDEIVKNEVQRAITADEEAIKRLSANYIDNVKAYTQKQKVRNPYTGQDESPDERLMRSIEEKIEIPESRKDDFRREIMNYIGAMAIDGKQFHWDSNERLRRALELKLFEDQKDSIKLTSLVSNVIDKETQEKIDIVKARMIKNMGYDEESASDVLNYVASIFARGDTRVRLRELDVHAEGRHGRHSRTKEAIMNVSNAHRIDQDAQRFRKIVRGHVRRNLRQYITNGEMIGRQGKEVVSIPVPQIELPRIRFSSQQMGGVGQGDGEVGTPLGPGDQDRNQGAGDQPGAHILEVEMSLGELAEILGEELALPRIEPKGKKNVEGGKVRYTGIRRVGPESLRSFKRTYRAALKRQMAAGIYNPKRPVVIPIRDDVRYRSWNVYPQPQNNAVIFYMMDVSGSMTRHKKELVRLTAFWIDTWLRHNYKSLSVRYIVHDAAAKEVDQHTFYHLREAGGTKISAAYQLCRSIMQTEYDPAEWNMYGFHFSDGENFGGQDDRRSRDILESSLIPVVNLFGYGQVPGGYGRMFMETVEQIEDEKLVGTKIDDREGIFDAIKAFLGKGL